MRSNAPVRLANAEFAVGGCGIQTLMNEHLLQAFDYDAWANRIWVEALETAIPRSLTESLLSKVANPAPWPDFPSDPHDRAAAVFAHLLFAQRIWLERCGTPVVPAVISSEAWITELTKGWKFAVIAIEPEKMITYRNGIGMEFTMPFSEITLHVLSHSTYHRGQLREIAESLRLPEIPETDQIGFFMERDR